MAVIGALCLGAGYFIAVTTKDPALANPDTRRLEVGAQGANNDRRAVYLLTAQDYTALTGNAALTLQPGETVVRPPSGTTCSRRRM